MKILRCTQLFDDTYHFYSNYNCNMSNTAASELFGRWFVEEKSADDRTLTRVISGNYEWGIFFEFNKDGTYSEYYTAPCGNDAGFYHYSGNWTRDLGTNVIKLSNIKAEQERLYRQLQKSEGSMKIVQFKQDVIEMKVIDKWTSD
ncbi:unnamed protein product [Didymodactylos carnosus]|uniref:Uncharacterized protein n=1 Tax=Didymodactylos carnosus TaxID=1234261 RepID=A0A8S2MCN5_9BILA|nr:unnamed protein product [Didymodactylos carnosus]CAF3934668.1 unnamed protein product [Didymodactylos carnosus]